MKAAKGGGVVINGSLRDLEGISEIQSAGVRPHHRADLVRRFDPLRLGKEYQECLKKKLDELKAARAAARKK